MPTYRIRDDLTDLNQQTQPRTPRYRTTVGVGDISAAIERQPRDVEVLTARETAVLQLMAEGRSNAGISQTLHLSSRTVENHAAAVFTKLGLT